VKGMKVKPKKEGKGERKRSEKKGTKDTQKPRKMREKGKIR
jgi:hypothetical protein